MCHLVGFVVEVEIGGWVRFRCVNRVAVLPVVLGRRRLVVPRVMIVLAVVVGRLVIVGLLAVVGMIGVVGAIAVVGAVAVVGGLGIMIWLLIREWVDESPDRAKRRCLMTGWSVYGCRLGVAVVTRGPIIDRVVGMVGVVGSSVRWGLRPIARSRSWLLSKPLRGRLCGKLST